jgi:RHS repeat-associated protein
MCNVDVITGELTRYEVDLALPGYIPFEFTRTYKSTRPQAGRLGHGWQHNWNIRLTVEQGRFVFTDQDAARVDLLPGAERDSARSADGAVTLRREQDYLLLERGDRRRYYFSAAPDARGDCLLVHIEDVHGNRLAFAYTQGGVLAGITDTVGRHIAFSYDAAGRISQLAIATGEPPYGISPRVRYAYDAANDLIAVEHPLRRVTRYTYVDHLMVRETDPAGHDLYWLYDESRRCVKTWRGNMLLFRSLHFDDQRRRVEVRNSLGYSTIYEYDENKNIVAETDPLGNARRTVLDAKGRQVAALSDGTDSARVSTFDEALNCLTEVGPRGTATRYYFDEAQRVIRVEDGDGNEWKNSYDDRGRLVHFTAPEDVEWHFEYAPQGYVRKCVNPLGHVLYQERDPQRRHIQYRDDLGLRYRKEYDLDGRLTALTDGLGRTTQFTLDAAGRTVRLSAPDGSVSEAEYDASDNIVAIRNALGHQSRFEYNAAGKPVREVNPLGEEITLQYDTEQQLVALRAPSGDQATFAYDPAGRLVSLTLFDGSTERYAYNDASELVGITTPGGAEVRLAYQDGSLASKTFADGSQTRFEFRDGFLTGAANASGAFARELDPRSRLAKEACGACALSFAYDKVDNLVAVAAGEDRTTTFRYDQRRRLVGIEDSHFGCYEFSYNAVDLIVEWRMPGGHRKLLEYDVVDRLTRITVLRADGQQLARQDFAYDLADQLVRSEVSAGGVSRVSEYEYDAAGRVTRVTVDGRLADHYTYDANGNITSCAAYASVSIAPGDRLLRAGDVHFAYDADGNLATRREPGGTTTYGCSVEGELTSVELPDGRRLGFAYEPTGRRVAKRSDDSATAYCWVNDTVYWEETNGERKHYLYLPSSFFPVAVDEAGLPCSCVLDQSATPSFLVTEAGDILWSRDETVYGRALSPSGSAPNCPIKFPGQYRDRETGLHYNYFRYYDPTVGRYLTPDPIGLSAGANFYRYVVNPLTWIDPFGLFEITVRVRCDWNAEQKKAFAAKVQRYNQAIDRERRKGNQGLAINKCERKAADLKREYEKCKEDNPNLKDPQNKSPKGAGKAVDCKDDLDHIVEVQMGGAQERPELCKNLTPVNASVNRSLGSQLKNLLADKQGQVLTKVKADTQCPPGAETRTPECA